MRFSAAFPSRDRQEALPLYRHRAFSRLFFAVAAQFRPPHFCQL